LNVTNFANTRNKYFVASSIEELLKIVYVLNVLDFIEETHSITSYDVVFLSSSYPM